jgi:hypothetical protein
MIYRTVYPVMFFAMFFSCASPSGVDVDQKLNTLTYKDEYGIVSYFTIDKKTYTLDDVVHFSLSTINNSDTHKVHIRSNHGPLWYCSIYDSEMDAVEKLPRWVTRTVYDFYVSPGDTFESDITWEQTKKSNDRYGDLKVFAGDYYITGNQPGLPAGKLGAWIRISEVGEPLSTKLHWYFSDQDSLKLDFLLRNRISSMLTFRPTLNPAAKIQFYNSTGDTLFREIPLDVNFSQITLWPKSDSHIFSFKASKSYLKNIGLKGFYKCRIVILCEERNIVAERTVVID